MTNPLKFREMTVPCSWCNAPVGSPCVNPLGEPYDYEVHIPRRRKYDKENP